MGIIQDILPRWVLVDGKPHNVSDFSGLEPRDRPDAFCPICMTPVILKLGEIRVHHYAHTHDVVCSSTQPETALHLNTKYHFYNELLNAKELFVEQKCGNCGISRKVLWQHDWDDVQVEYISGVFRIDVALIKNKEVLGAIEILRAMRWM